MAKGEGLDNIIKESYKGSKKAPEGMWAAMSENVSDSNLDTKIETAYKETAKQASMDSWPKIKNQLIIDYVWRKIAQEISRKPIVIWWRLLAASLFLTGIVGTSLYYSSSTHVETGNEEMNQVELIKGQQIEANNNHDVSNGPNTFTLENDKDGEEDSSFEASNITSTTLKTSLVDIKHSSLATTTKHGKNRDTIIVYNELNGALTNTTISTICSDTLSHNAETSLIILERFDNLGLASYDFEKAKIKEFWIDSSGSKGPPRLEIGLTAGINNTWILNNETKEGFKPTSLVTNVLAFGHDIGFTGVWNFGRKSSLAINGFVSTKIRQKTGLYNQGQYINKTIEYSYRMLSVSLRKELGNRAVFDKRVFIIGAGGYVSILNNRTVVENGVLVIENSTYKPYDFGVKVDLAQLKTVGKFRFEYGVRSQLGLHNLYNGNINTPANFNLTRSLKLGVYGGVKYSF